MGQLLGETRGETVDGRVRRLAAVDIDRIVELQAAVGAGLPRGFLWPRSRTGLAALIDGTSGLAFGIEEGPMLAAVAFLRVPSAGRPNAGMPFPLVPEADWPLHACLAESTMVNPAMRGRGYQRALLEARRAYADAAGMRWLCAGVHLLNGRSWANLLAAGMAIVGLRLDMGYPVIGLVRRVAGPAIASEPRDRRVVEAGDTDRHQAALADGYVGVRLAPGGTVIYQRRL